MNLLRLTRTTPFKLAMLYAVMFSLFSCLIFGLMYHHIVRHVTSHLRNSVRDEAANLIDESKLVGSITTATEGRLRLNNRQFDYLVLDKTGKPVAGNWPNPLPWQDSWQVVNPPNSTKTEVKGDSVVMAMGQTLPDGSTLIVGRGMKSLVEIKEIIWQAFGFGGGLILLLSTIGGFVMSAGFLRKIDCFNSTAARIMAGKMGERIPIAGTRDAFDQLAANLNLMLDKVESFMEGMRQVTNDIAHDLRTPLTRLRQNLERATLKAKSVGEFREAVDKAILETDDVLATFSGMLRISQIEAGSGGMEPTLVNLSDLCHKMLEIYEPLVRDKGTKLIHSVADGIFLSCNELLMTQMLANLIENALNHTPPGTNIMLELVSVKDGIIMGVNDRGPGIPAADRERVTKRFVRLENSRNTPGNGLGLALVVAVAGRYGGQLHLSDNKPGLRADIYFPKSL